MLSFDTFRFSASIKIHMWKQWKRIQKIETAVIRGVFSRGCHFPVIPIYTIFKTVSIFWYFSIVSISNGVSVYNGNSLNLDMYLKKDVPKIGFSNDCLITDGYVSWKVYSWKFSFWKSFFSKVDGLSFRSQSREENQYFVVFSNKIVHFFNIGINQVADFCENVLVLPLIGFYLDFKMVVSQFHRKMNVVV